MPTNEFIANALDVADICTITVSGTWATNDTATITLNGKDLVVTLGTPVTTTDVATLIARAWESSTRLSDALGSSNVGGQSVPEFREIICTSSGAVLTFTTRNSNDAGVPFQAYLTRAENTAGSGALGAVTSVQAATGKNWWSNADNWSLGTVPANAELIYLRDSSVDLCYGLPAGTLEVQIYRYNTFTGRLGLPKIRHHGTQDAYYEYRPRYVVLDDAGAGSTATHYIGLGPGQGSPLCNLRQDVLPTTFEVGCTRTQIEPGELFVNNLIAPGGATFKINKGTVNCGNQDDATAAVTALNISGVEGQLGGIDVALNENATASLTVNQIGGRLALGQASWSSNGITMRGGEITKRCPCPSIVWANGTVYDETNGTITAGTMNTGAILDVSRGSGTLTITNITRHPGSTIKDPGKRIVHTNAVVTTGQLADVLRDTDYGYGRSYQISG